MTTRRFVRYRARKAPAPLESTTQAQIAAYLKVVLDPALYRASAIPSGGGGVVRGAMLKRMGLVRGLPDIIIFSGDGEFWGLEVKRPGAAKNTSDAQDDWIDWAGGRIAVVTSIEEAKAHLVRWGVLA